MKCVSGRNHAYDEKALTRYFIHEGRKNDQCEFNDLCRMEIKDHPHCGKDAWGTGQGGRNTLRVQQGTHKALVQGCGSMFF